MKMNEEKAVLVETRLLNLKEVLENKINLSELKQDYRIYFLIKNEEVVYVGKSICYQNRVTAHTNDKDFDSYSTFKCQSQIEMDYSELKYISEFQPFYNKTLPCTERYMSLKKIKLLLDLETWPLKRFIKDNKIKPVFSLGDQYSYDINDFHLMKEV